MSFQWTLVAAFLYSEIAIIVLLLMPFISVTLWQKVFKSRFLKSLAAYANYYSVAFVAILLLLFLDSIREMRKHAAIKEVDREHGRVDAERHENAQIFRAERNYYIAGFALFLAPVIHRLASLISQQATLKASHEASLKQAKSASDVASRLMKEKEKAEKEGGIIKENETNSQRAEYESKLQGAQDRLRDVEKELKKTKLDLQTVKLQAEGTNREYDRLLEEHSNLQKELAKAAGDKDKDKKDE